jgi:hypothetical protein
MRIASIVGAFALVGVAILLGLALLDRPAAVTTDTSPFVFDPPATSSSVATVPGAPTSPPVSVPPAPATGSPTTPATTPVPTTAPVQRQAIVVRVINGGGPPQSATNMTARLREAGFAPARPADARDLVQATRVIFAPGHEAEATAVNEVVQVAPSNVVAATTDDPNWAAFGGDLGVLVVVGPPGP